MIESNQVYASSAFGEDYVMCDFLQQMDEQEKSIVQHEENTIKKEDEKFRNSNTINEAASPCFIGISAGALLSIGIAQAVLPEDAKITPLIAGIIILSTTSGFFIGKSYADKQLSKKTDPEIRKKISRQRYDRIESKIDDIAQEILHSKSQEISKQLRTVQRKFDSVVFHYRADKTTQVDLNVRRAF